LPPSSCSGQSAPQPGIAQQPPEGPSLTAAIQVYSHPDPRQMHLRPEQRKLPTKDERPHSRHTLLRWNSASADSLLAPRQIHCFGTLQTTSFRHFPLRQPCPAGFRSMCVHDLKHTFGYRLRAAGVQFEDRKRSFQCLRRRQLSLVGFGRLNPLVVAVQG